MTPEKMFPIMPMRRDERTETARMTIPWFVIAPHEAQAKLNHDQTLERLAQRGGLSPCEAVAVLENRPWKKMSAEYAVNQLLLLVSERLKSQPQPSPNEAGEKKYPFQINNTIRVVDSALGVLEGTVEEVAENGYALISLGVGNRRWLLWSNLEHYAIANWIRYEH